MKNKHLTYIKNILLPCLVFSTITGILTGALIFAFRLSASAIIDLSARLYSAVRGDLSLAPWLILGAALLGLISALLLKFAPACRGGGIPTSIALLRGLTDFHWVKSIFALFTSAMLTYLVGVPLGNEGPSVQMGTAVGRGAISLLAKDHRAWDRYIMTGGACAGFAAATGAPLSGIFFAFEEAHRRFSPMIFMVAAMSVIASYTTMGILCELLSVSPSAFHFTVDLTLPMKYLWAALVVGVVCGVIAVLFTALYRTTRRVINEKLSRLPFTLKLVIIFVAVALIGLVSDACIGSGHDLIERLAHGHMTWYLLILYLCVRAVLLVISNITGVTGGLFIPTLTFGAIIGALCAHLMSLAGLLPDQYHLIMVIIGMTAFLGASSRTPITAITFGIEALCGFSNILPVMIGVTISYLVIETVGLESFTETVIEGKVEAAQRGKQAQIVDTHLTVMQDTFAIGKELRDILWPPTCVVLSVQKNANTPHGEGGLGVGDMLHVHYRTYDAAQTTRALEAIVGNQTGDAHQSIHTGDENHQVPNL